MTKTNGAPGPRATAIADQEGYGALRESHRVNRAHRRRRADSLLVLPLGAVLCLVVGWPYSPWHGDDRGASIGGALVYGAVGLILLGLTAWSTLPAVLARLRPDDAMVHVYEEGAIAERPRGHCSAWRHERATVRYVSWRQQWESSWRDRPQLWVTFHRDGETICFDGLAPEDRAGLPALARALGADDEPEEVGELRVLEAPTPF